MESSPEWSVSIIVKSLRISSIYERVNTFESISRFSNSIEEFTDICCPWFDACWEVFISFEMLWSDKLEILVEVVVVSEEIESIDRKKEVQMLFSVRVVSLIVTSMSARALLLEIRKVIWLINKSIVCLSSYILDQSVCLSVCHTVDSRLSLWSILLSLDLSNWVDEDWFELIW